MREHAAYVFDLYGVVRDFAPGDAGPAIEAALGLRADGHRPYVFTNGTDHVPQELELLDITRLFDGLLNSADLGVAMPEQLAYAAAHRAIEADLGRLVDRGDIWFTDDRVENLAAAAGFGWDAELFSLGQSRPEG